MDVLFHVPGLPCSGGGTLGYICQIPLQGYLSKEAESFVP